MKVLGISEYVYIPGISEFERNSSGFGRMVRDICQITGEKADVYLITNVITKGYDFGYKIISHTKKDFISSGVFLKIFGAGFSFFSKGTLKEKIKNIYYKLNYYFIINNIKHNDYDIIHLHGISKLNYLLIKYFIKKKIKFTITLHGLINEPDVLTSQYNKSLEDKIIKLLINNNIKFSVVSSGVKAKIIEKYSIQKDYLIYVILNGTSISFDNDSKINIREKLSINPNSKLMICVSTVMHRKNQIRVLMGYNSLPEYLKKDLFLVFIGRVGEEDYKKRMDEYILQNKMESHVFFVGNLEKKELSCYYQQSNYNILLSLSEGFGLSIIEGYTFGLPCLTYYDLDAIDDLYNPSSMMLISSRDDDVLFNQIKAFVSYDWNKSTIIEFSKKYTLDSIGNDYISLYKTILEQWKREYVIMLLKLIESF